MTVTLTKEQEERLVEHRNMWLEIAKSPGNMDREKTKWAVKGLCELAKLKVPTEYLFVSSPIMCVVAGPVYTSMYDDIEESFVKNHCIPGISTKEAWDAYQVPKTEGSHDWTLDGCIRKAIDLIMEKTHQDTMAAIDVTKTDLEHYDRELRDTISNLSIDLLDMNKSILAKNVERCCTCYVSTGMWPGYCANATFLRDVLGQDTEKLDEYEYMNRECGIWWPTEKICVCSEKPLYVRLTEGDVVHCEDGPAIEFADGLKLWILSGRLVDEQLVLRPETQTIEQINNESDEDLRSLRIERFGYINYIEQTKATLLDQRHNDVDNQEEALFSLTVPYAHNRIVVSCPTRRCFSLGVPGEVQTCVEAQRWLAGEEAFNTIART